MKEPWIVFYLDGEELCAVTADDSFAGEIAETREQLAYENDVTADEISWQLEMR